MFGRRATAGLALLCALLFSAIAVQSAAATAATNTTAYTCVKEKGLEDFSDEHCDVNVGAGKGKYGHVEIKVGQTTEVEVSNKTTGSATDTAKFFGEPFKVKTEIECKTLTGTGSLTNTEVPEKSGNHQISGNVKAKFSSCTVIKPAKCAVEEPIAANSDVEGVEGLEGKGEMGLEFKPEKGGKTFSTITLLHDASKECPLDKKPFNVEGTAIGTSGSGSQTTKWSGSTVYFTKAMTEKTLKAAEKFAWFESKSTVIMKPEAGKEANPISLTTATP